MSDAARTAPAGRRSEETTVKKDGIAFDASMNLMRLDRVFAVILAMCEVRETRACQGVDQRNDSVLLGCKASVEMGGGGGGKGAKCVGQGGVEKRRRLQTP
jgi:hypothetical protein